MLKCINEVIKAGKGAIGKAEAQEIIASIEKRFQAQMPKQEMTQARRDELASSRKDPLAMTTAERMQVAAEEAFAAKLKEKTANVKRAELQIQVQAAAQTTIAMHGHGVKGVQEYLLKTVQGKITGETELLMAELYKGLNPFIHYSKGKLSDSQQLSVMKSILDPDLLKRLADPAKLESASPEEFLAYQFRLVEDQVWSRKKAGGADLNYLPGHFPQSWDANGVRWFGLGAADKLRFLPGRSPALIKAAKVKAQGAWVDYIMPLLDKNRYVDTETGLQLPDEKLREVMGEVWTTLASHGLAGDPGIVTGGTSSLAKSLEVSREIHFKNAESFIAANNAFGTKDLFTAMTANIKRHATEIALLETLGPNPDSGFKTALQYGKSIEAGKTTFGREGSRRVELIYDEIRGNSNIISEDKFDLISRVMQGARNMITSAKLGMLPASQLADMATFGAIAKSDGLGAGEAIRLALSFLNPANKVDRDAAQFHGMLAQMVINDVALRYGDASKGPGWTSKAADATVTWSGAKFWTDSLKQSFHVLIGKHMADYKEIQFADLEPRFKKMLERQGINKDDWNIIRQSETAEIAGRQIITPVMVSKVVTREMAGSDSRNYTIDMERFATRQVRDAAAKVAAMMNEEADVAVVSPGMYERSWVKDGTKPGTISGELFRSILLFKTFSVAMVTKVLPRIKMETTAANRATFAAQLLTGMMITGAMGVQLKEVWKGRNPRDMSDPDFWGAAFMQAGGLGIFGDFFLANANRFGGGPVTSFLGPVVGMADDVLKLTTGNVQEIAKGEDTHIAAESIQFAKNYAPLMNLWYTRLALDHLLFFQIQEAANPGYLRRMKAITKKENNQTYWWDPESNLP